MRTLCELMECALGLVWSWCREVDFIINPGKTIIGPFTRRRKFKLDTLVLGSTIIYYVNEVKYMGIILKLALEPG